VPATDAEAWATAVSELWRDPELRAHRGERALARARSQFGEGPYHEQLMRLYGQVSP
jgi:glycosyltransferase involved in cell wall biosynthesis